MPIRLHVSVLQMPIRQSFAANRIKFLRPSVTIPVADISLKAIVNESCVFSAYLIEEVHE